MSLHVENRTLSNPDGTTFELSIVTPHSGKGAVIVPHFQYRGLHYLALVEQWREPIQKRTLELPRGTVDEFNEQEAARELKEETGLEAKSFVYHGSIYPDTGLLTTEVEVYSALIATEDVDSQYTFNNKYENDITVHVDHVAVAATKLRRAGCSMSIAALDIVDATSLFNLSH